MGLIDQLRAIPLPKRMKDMSKDARGYPIPYTVMRDRSGKPHFTISEESRRVECLRKKRCTICGKRLEKTFWFVGGPLSAFHPHGAYADLAMHTECVTYALQTCPYLAMPKYLTRIDAGNLPPGDADMVRIYIDPTMISERPEVFVAVHTTGFTVTEQVNIVPVRPYLDVQFWRHGVRVSVEEGMRLGKLGFKKP